MAAEEKKKNQGQSALIYSKWSLTCCCRVLFVRCRLVLWIELWRSSGMASCVCVSCTRETNRYRLVRCITVRTGKSPPRTTHRLSFLVFVFGSRFLSVMPTCAQACVQVLGAVPRLLFECFSRTCSRGGQKGRPSRGRAGAGLRQRRKGKEGEGHTVVPPEM